jgi:ankyrin repeat protein
MNPCSSFRVQALACVLANQQPKGYHPTQAARVGTPGWTLNFVLLVCVLLSLAGFAGCAAGPSDKPTPDAAKRFLKLRGYEFNDASFLRAAAANDVTTVNGFFAAGINPNVKDEDSGATALIFAATHDNPEMVTALLRGGADANVKDNGGFNAILRAIQNRHDAISDLLVVQDNLDLNARGSIGGTILMSYVWREQEDTVRKLLERGADPNLSDQDGDMPLHGAAMRGNVRLLQMLLDKGANPNARNKLGGTALMWTGTYGQEEAARVLLEKGADPTLKDHNGITASGWAAKNHNDDVAQLLRDAEKKR